MWDDRYSEEGFAFGTKANDFLIEAQSQIPKGRVLCLAEGEGRNAVFLAEQGYDVLAVDASSVGLEKAKKLANERGVKITTQVSDLADFKLEQNAWDGIVSIFCHLPVSLRQNIHQQICTALKPGGVLVLEAYRPLQLEYKTGGPPVAELMMTQSSLQTEFSSLNIKHCCELVRPVIEGKYHTGDGAVVQLIACRE